MLLLSHSVDDGRMSFLISMSQDFTHSAVVITLIREGLAVNYTALYCIKSQKRDVMENS